MMVHHSEGAIALLVVSILLYRHGSLKNVGCIDVSRLSAHISARFPRRLFVGFSLVMSAALILLWLGRIIPYTLAGRFPDEIARMTTLATQAFDLGMVVPLLLSTAILLWQLSAWGYLIAGISLTFGFVMSITLPVWIAVPLIQAGQMNLIEATPFLLLCLVGLYVAGRFFWCVQEEKAPSRGEAQKDHSTTPACSSEDVDKTEEILMSHFAGRH